MDDTLNGVVEVLLGRGVYAHRDGKEIDGEADHQVGGGKLAETDSILLGGEDELARALELVKGVANALEVGNGVAMVVGKAHRGDRAELRHVLYHGLRMSNAGEEECSVDGVQGEIGTSHKRQGMAIVDMAEENLLVGTEAETGDEAVARDGVELFGGFGDDNHAGTTTRGAELTEVAKGHDVVGEIGLVVLGEEDVDGGFDGAVLVDVIKDNDLRRKLALEEPTDALDPILADGDGEFGELAGQHGGLVAQTGGAVAAIVKEEALGVAAVATAEERRLVVRREETKKILDMRGLACASGTKVAHPDSSDGGCHLALDAKGEHQVSKPYAHSIPHRERKKNTGYCFAK